MATRGEIASRVENVTSEEVQRRFASQGKG